MVEAIALLRRAGTALAVALLVIVSAGPAVADNQRCTSPATNSSADVEEARFYIADCFVTLRKQHAPRKARFASCEDDGLIMDIKKPDIVLSSKVAYKGRLIEIEAVLQNGVVVSFTNDRFSITDPSQAAAENQAASAPTVTGETGTATEPRCRELGLSSGYCGCTWVGDELLRCSGCWYRPARAAKHREGHRGHSSNP